MGILVSIIVPVYKVPEKLLRKCIESIINQSLKNIEIILVDDESPDNCGKICDEYAKKDNRIIVIHQKNKGLSGARNAGFYKSRGKWITFVDGDDYIDIDMCKILYNANKSKNIDIVCCEYIRKSASTSFECKLNGINNDIYINEECKYLQEKILDFNAHFSEVYCKLIKRKMLMENNIIHNEDVRQGSEGIEFNMRLFEVVKKVVIVHKPLYYYIYNENSISNKHDEKNHYYNLKCFESIKRVIEKSSNRENLLKNFYNRLIYVIITTAISGYFSPTNEEPYKVKKQKYQEFLKQPLIQESMKNADLKGIDFKRKIILLLIKLKMFRVINVLGIIRKKSKGK